MKYFRKIRVMYFVAAFTVSVTFTSCAEMLQILEALAATPTENTDNKKKTQDNTNNTTDGGSKSKTKTKTE